MKRDPAPPRRSRKISSPLMKNLGAQEANEWLGGFALRSNKPWYVEISLATADGPAARTFDDAIDTRFHLNIYREEWGVFFCHGSRASWIRVTDVPFVHGRDEFGLLGALRPLARVGDVLRDVERRYGLRFNRDQGLIRTNLRTAKPPVRSWLEAL